MLTCTINASGKTESDMIDALEEALTKVRQGFLSGNDSNDNREYDFNVNGEEEEDTEEDTDEEEEDEDENKYFSLGQWVMVAEDNDNDNYDSFRGKRLKIISVARNTEEHPGYDNSMEGMPLYDLEDEEGNTIDCSLYAYELEEA